MIKEKIKRTLYRVKFQNKEENKSYEVVVSSIESSDFLGLVKLSNFIFNESKKQIVLSSESEARKRFSKVNALHIPYHNISFIEEFDEEDTDYKKLPFMKEVLLTKQEEQVEPKL